MPVCLLVLIMRVSLCSAPNCTRGLLLHRGMFTDWCAQISGGFELHSTLQVVNVPPQKAVDKEAGTPATRWVSAKQLQGEGLSSSVCKVAKLAAKSSTQGKQGIKRFFAAVAT